MTNLFKPSIGAVMSADIAVPEHDKVLQFYSQVLTTGDQPLWQPDLMNNRGMSIIGLGAQSPEYAELPLQWMPHIQVADVGVSVTQAMASGGRELMHGKDDDDVSQWAVIEDPNGVAFGLIPVVSDEMIQGTGNNDDADQSDATGCIAWLDLTVENAAAINDFYCAVVGWQAEGVSMQDGEDTYADYNMLNGDGQPAAGVCHAKGTNSNLPSVWLLYLPVGDLTASLIKVKAAGGKIIHRSTNKAGAVTQALIADPVGVNFVLVQG